jgi:hypothetical protein
MRGEVFMGCVMKVTKTDDGRTVCGVSGALCQVSGLLAALEPVEICLRHRRMLEKVGLVVEKCIPLVAAATKAEAKRAAYETAESMGDAS